jgi:hypothetical protein
MKTRDGAQQGRLSGAVGADNRQDLTLSQTETYVINREQLSVMDTEFANL